MTDTDALVEFLRANIDNDEEYAMAARGALTGYWQPGVELRPDGGGVQFARVWDVGPGGPKPVYEGVTEMVLHADASPSDVGVNASGIPVEGHALTYAVGLMATYDPARVLAECKAKRRLIKEWGQFDTYNGEELLKVLAMVYADRPGYREEWRA